MASLPSAARTPGLATVVEVEPVSSTILFTFDVHVRGVRYGALQKVAVLAFHLLNQVYTYWSLSVSPHRWVGMCCVAKQEKFKRTCKCT